MDDYPEFRTTLEISSVTNNTHKHRCLNSAAQRHTLQWPSRSRAKRYGVSPTYSFTLAALLISTSPPSPGQFFRSLGVWLNALCSTVNYPTDGYATTIPCKLCFSNADNASSRDVYSMSSILVPPYSRAFLTWHLFAHPTREYLHQWRAKVIRSQFSEAPHPKHVGGLTP